jgi:uroporphyrinogen-III synthase
LALKPRVLVTRPEPGASRTAARLAAAGFDPVVLPLTRISPLDFTLPEGPFDAVIVTSAQALNAVRPQRILHLPVFAVGETTAESAKSAGFGKVITADGSVESIAALVRKCADPAARLLFLCGKVRRPELEATLGDAGFHLTAIETYDAPPAVYSEEEAAARLGDAPFAAVTLMSARAAELFVALARGSKFERLFKSCEVVCFSPRIADALGKETGWKVRVTRHASEDALVELLSLRFADR